MFLKFFPLTQQKQGHFEQKLALKKYIIVGPEPNMLTKQSKSSPRTLEFIVIAAVPRRDVCRSSRKELVLLSGFLADFLVDHMVISPVAVWLLLPTNNGKKEDDEEEEQTTRHCQTDDHFSIFPF